MSAELSISKTARQNKILVWAQEVESCRNSGLTVLEWCAQHNIKPKTYYYRQKQVFDAAVEQHTFVKAEVRENPTAESQIAARVTVNGITIEIMSEANVKTAVALITALKDA